VFSGYSIVAYNIFDESPDLHKWKWLLPSYRSEKGTSPLIGNVNVKLLRYLQLMVFWVARIELVGEGATIHCCTPGGWWLRRAAYFQAIVYNPAIVRLTFRRSPL
jgi:hypothetical protein